MNRDLYGSLMRIGAGSPGASTVLDECHCHREVFRNTAYPFMKTWSATGTPPRLL
jgi:hypothetical protein